MKEYGEEVSDYKNRKATPADEAENNRHVGKKKRVPRSAMEWAVVTEFTFGPERKPTTWRHHFLRESDARKQLRKLTLITSKYSKHWLEYKGERVEE